MKIYVLRHGLAEERARSGRDADRALTPKGQRKTWRAAEAMEAMGVEFDVCLSSPYKRARQTAEIVTNAFNREGEVVLADALKPGASFESLVSTVRDMDPVPGSVLVVGHEPFLSEFISLLISGITQVRIDLKKGALCLVEVSALKAGKCGALRWLLTPGQMRLVG